jgi:hypothetical protein
MQEIIEIPDYRTACERIEKGTASQLDLFIYANEPAGMDEEQDFRDSWQS